jgi:phosphoribosylanthranilate isomerase
MTRPYIGVTGFSTLGEVEAFEALLRQVTLPMSHDLYVGILISAATFGGVPSRTPRYPGRDTAYALLRRVRTVATPVIHFNTQDPRPLAAQLIEVLRYEHAYDEGTCRSVQLNVPWPARTELLQLRDAFPELSVILQVPLWQEENQDPGALRTRLEPYPGLIQHLLLDPSGGRGTALEPRLLALAAEVQRAFPSTFVLGIAGGLTGETVRPVVALAAQGLGRRDFSVDTEGKVRGGTCQGRRVGDVVNPDKVLGYLQSAIAAFGEPRV